MGDELRRVKRQAVPRGSLYAAVLYPFIAVLTAIGLVACGLLLYELFAVGRDNAVCVTAVCVILLTGGLLAWTLRLKNQFLQLGAVIQRVSDAVDEISDVPKGEHASVRITNFATDNIEALFDRYQASLNREYEEELLARQAQYAILQSQINPHFLYNTLDSMRGNALDKDVPEIAEIAEALSHFFRYSISGMGDFVTVQQELDSVLNYLRIQRYRFGDRIRLVIECPEDEITSRFYMPKLTLQPIVENCFYHGFKNKGGGTITIRVIFTRRNVLIQISDDGEGMDEPSLKRLQASIAKETYRTVTDGRKQPSHGIALHNVNQRLKLYFGQGCGIYISSAPNAGTDIEVRFPVADKPPVWPKREDEES